MAADCVDAPFDVTRNSPDDAVTDPLLVMLLDEVNELIP
jgi:hypothetical protein